MIKEEDLIPGTEAKYGIEFESIIVDTSNEDYICISDDKLYDTIIDKSVTNDMNNFMKDLVDFDIPNLFEYHVSGLICNKPPRSDKRLEFASRALSPTNRKPSELFDTLERMINAFNQWTDEKYYLPDHGTITFLSDDKKQVYTTLTGGTHVTISFPLTKTDNPVTWKYFMWLFTGLVTMYQPIYVALNGAPSPKTKGSERQRTSGSIVIGSAYIYDIFTPESKRYEIFINTPDGNHLSDYPEYAHWNDKDLSYKESGPWRGGNKADIGNSSYQRSDSFRLFRRNDFITDDKEKVLNKQFYEKYETLIHNIASMTSNLIEFRFFDNEPIQHLHNKFNLLIRMADYAYEQTKNFEAAIGIEDLKDFLPRQIDNRLNIRPLVNKKPWHDAVLESMNEGLDATFNEEFIYECYKFLELTPFSTLLENPELKEISAIDLNKIFVDEMNTAEHHFSEYFRTDDPTLDYSKEYQIKKLRESQKIAKNKMKAYDEEKARKEESERLQYEKLKAEHMITVKEIIIENITKLKESEINKELLSLINKYINIDKFAETTVFYIYGGRLSSGLIEEGVSFKEIKEHSYYIVNSGISISYTKEDFEQLNNWFKDSLLPYLREKDPILKSREDTEDRNREREREREQQLQREREKTEEQINFIANIVTKNIEKITDESLKDLILNTIHLRKISDILREVIYIDRATISNMNINIIRYLYISTLENVAWIVIPSEKQNLLIKWFRESLLPDLESNVPELRERSQPQITTDRIIPQAEADKKREISQIIVKTVNRLNNVSQHTIATTLLYTKLINILYHRIYVVQQSFDEIEEVSELIIKDATPENITRTFEQDDIVRAWFKVGLLSELRNTLLTRFQSIETRNHGGVIEHRHTSNNYWHPETRIHTAQIDIPVEHISSEITQQEKINKIQIAIRNNVENLNPELYELIFNSISYKKISILLQKWIYEQSYTTSDIRDSANQIIDKTKFRDLDEAEHNTIKFWIQGILIDVLKTVTLIQETRTLQTEEVPTTHATELEVLEIPEETHEYPEERIENETSIILDIIKLNISNLENHTLKDIIKKYIIYSYFATSLHTMIYQKHYTTIDIENNMDILLSEGFHDEDNETDVQDSEVIKLLVTWITDYLIPDLVKGTSLQFGGIGALFG